MWTDIERSIKDFFFFCLIEKRKDNDLRNEIKGHPHKCHRSPRIYIYILYQSILLFGESIDNCYPTRRDSGVPHKIPWYQYIDMWNFIRYTRYHGVSDKKIRSICQMTYSVLYKSHKHKTKLVCVCYFKY